MGVRGILMEAKSASPESSSSLPRFVRGPYNRFKNIW
jgi:hypothetical protein